MIPVEQAECRWIGFRRSDEWFQQEKNLCHQITKMISFELDSTKEAVTIYFDKDGAEELIDYINFTKGYDDHIHLVVGNELSSVIFGQGIALKHVTIRQVEL